MFKRAFEITDLREDRLLGKTDTILWFLEYEHKSRCFIIFILNVIDKQPVVWLIYTKMSVKNYMLQETKLLFRKYLLLKSLLTLVFVFLEIRGQFQQPSGRKRKCAGRHSLGLFSFTNKTVPNFTIASNSKIR